MFSYKKSGVDVASSNKCSKIAYAYAKKTFSRKGFGIPASFSESFSGPIDMGKFYMLLNDDGVGTKLVLGIKLNKLDTLGTDLFAMVADDAVCLGGEVVAITNTIDVPKANKGFIGNLMKGLSKICREQNAIIAGGEIAELGKTINYPIWNASSVAVVEKNKIITGENVSPGDLVVSLKSRVLRSNGMTLARHILKVRYGENWYNKKYDKNYSWGEILLTPSQVYHSAVLDLIGRFGENRIINVHAIAHITGGGIPGNLKRVIGKFGAEIYDAFVPHEALKKLQKFGKLPDMEAYTAWNQGNGMMLVVNSNDADDVIKIMAKNKIQAKICGKITREKGIKILSKGLEKEGKWLKF